MNTLLSITLVFLFSFGSEQIENSFISEPRAISVDMNGSIYIADTGNYRILKFDSDGNFIKSTGGFGWENQQFDMPLDICAKSVLDIFVVDYNNQRIERYDKDFNYISSLYSDESKPENLQFGYPRGISISIHGELILIDSENRRLLKINSFGEPEESFGDFSQGKGKLDEPVQIEISSDDKIYVADKASSRIVVYDYFGNYLSEIGTGLLDEPTGIWYDKRNWLWVADSKLKEFFVFSNQGDLLLRRKNRQSEKDLFKKPVDIVTFTNRVFVLDGNKIFVFEINR